MSIEREITKNDDLIGDLGLIVGIEQGCSISAAEAYKAAHEFAAAGTERDAFLVDDDPLARQLGTATDLQKTVHVGDRKAALTILTPYSFATKHTPYRRFLRKMVDVSKVRQNADPLLCARIGRDTFLPLARFALHDDSEHCSYVQLGSEMRDETVVMTQLDERTSRHEVVEAIRTVFSEAKTQRGGWSVVADEKAKSILQKLINRQAETHRDNLYEAQEAMLARRCVEKIENGKTTDRRLTVMGENDTNFTEVFSTQPLLTDCRLDEVRFAELTLIKGQGDKNTRLVAIVRGELAFPIASIIKETGKVVFESLPDIREEKDKARLISMLLDRLANKPLFTLPPARIVMKPQDASRRKREAKEKWVELKKRVRDRFGAVPMGQQEYFFDETNYNHAVPAALLYQRGLLREEEVGEQDPFKAGMTSWGVNNITKELDKLFDFPERYEGQALPNSLDVPPVWLALSRLPLRQRAVERLFEELGAAKKVREKLGETSQREERFVRQVQEMLRSTDIYMGTIDDVDTGTNKASVDVAARLFKEHTQYRVELYAKASALKTQTFPERPYKALRFDITGSIIGDRDDDQLAKLEMISRFSNTLQRITPKP